MAIDANFRKVDCHRWLYVTAVSDMLGTIVDGHGDSRNKHVDDIANNSTNNQRINRDSHEEEDGLFDLVRCEGGVLKEK